MPDRTLPMAVEKAERIIEEMYEGKFLATLTGKERAQFAALRRQNADIDQQYERAREMMAHCMASETVPIADTEMDAQVARNRITSRQWYAGKLLPQVYGDRLNLDVTTTVDISKALAEARDRVRLQCDSTDVIDIQAVDVKQVVDNSATDHASVDPPDPFEDDPESGGSDPFS